MNSITHSVEQRKQLFLTNSKAVHGDFYDYSKVQYKNARTKVEIICPEHGPFFQLPDSHSSGRGCSMCGIHKSKSPGFSIRKTNEAFIQECTEKHKGFYTYSKTAYIGKTEKVTITCPVHGDFLQKAENHRNGQGCPSCGTNKAHEVFKKDTVYFEKVSRKVHGDTYDYSKTEYKGNKLPVDIICKKHGVFTISRAQYHYVGNNPMGCPKCVLSGVSAVELELYSFLESLGAKVIARDRSVIKPLELDFVLPDHKVAIEYNGLYWHSEEQGKDRRYHIDKTERAKSEGYRLIHIFEDEWVSKKDIVKSRLAHILKAGISDKKFARKLVVKNPTRKEADLFFEQTHIQGNCMYAQAYGLYEGETLVACMTFGKNRFTKDGAIELIRYSTSGNIVGGFSKLLKAFIRDFPEVKRIDSYSDKRWSEGGVYTVNGFIKSGDSEPSYFYVPPRKVERLNRMKFQKHKLATLLEKYNPLVSETENMKLNGYTRVFDCGTDKWTLNLD